MPLNLPCYEMCFGTCATVVVFETGGLGLVACVLGCELACNSDTLVSQNNFGDLDDFGGDGPGMNKIAGDVED